MIFYKSYILPGIMVFLVFFVSSCDNETTEMIDNPRTDFPQRSIINAHIISKDSGRIVIDLRSPLIEEYTLSDSPYTVFPKGLDLDFYTKNTTKPGFFKADWARMSDMTNIYECRGNVLVINDKGDSLKTHHLFWFRDRKMLFTSDTAYILTMNGDSLRANNGLESSDDLKTYRLFNTSGVKYFDEKDQ